MREIDYVFPVPQSQGLFSVARKQSQLGGVCIYLRCIFYIFAEKKYKYYLNSFSIMVVEIIMCWI